MDKAVANKLNVLRAFATAVDPYYPMETAPGIYKENVFRGLDYALEQARQRGLKVQAPLFGCFLSWQKLLMTSYLGEWSPKPSMYLISQPIAFSPYST